MTQDPQLRDALIFCLRNVWFYSSIGLNIGLGLVLWGVKHSGVLCS